MRLLSICIYLCLVSLSQACLANDFDRHFAVVFADAETTAKYGPLPLDRRIIARSIDALAEAGAKAVVIKFFLDRDGDTDGDRMLARALTRLPVVLQARIDETEQAPNDLPARFTVPLHSDTAIKGDSGWIPAAQFAGKAHDICFADYQGLPLPVIEGYRGRTVKSLPLCAIELAVGDKADIKPGLYVQIGDIKHRLDQLNRVAVTLDAEPALQYIPLHELVENERRASRVAGKVVILGYDGPQIHSIETDTGSIGAHRYYVYLLHELLEGDNR